MRVKVVITCAVAFLLCLASVWYSEKKKNDHAADVSLLFAYTVLFLAVGMIIERTTGGF